MEPQTTQAALPQPMPNPVLPVNKLPPLPPEPVIKPPRSNKLQIIAGLIVLLLLIGGAVYIFATHQSQLATGADNSTQTQTPDSSSTESSRINSDQL